MSGDRVNLVDPRWTIWESYLSLLSVEQSTRDFDGYYGRQAFVMHVSLTVIKKRWVRGTSR